MQLLNGRPSPTALTASSPRGERGPDEPARHVLAVHDGPRVAGAEYLERHPVRARRPRRLRHPDRKLSSKAARPCRASRSTVRSPQWNPPQATTMPALPKHLHQSPLHGGRQDASKYAGPNRCVRIVDRSAARTVQVRDTLRILASSEPPSQEEISSAPAPGAAKRTRSAGASPCPRGQSSDPRSSIAADDDQVAWQHQRLGTIRGVHQIDCLLAVFEQEVQLRRKSWRGLKSFCCLDLLRGISSLIFCPSNAHETNRTLPLKKKCTGAPTDPSERSPEVSASEVLRPAS